jgi:hypothetical protein
MRSASFTLANVFVDDAELPLMSADLMVVRRPESVELDWECIAITIPTTPLPLAPVRIVMDDLASGRQFDGHAVVVRSDEQRHVFRGGGNLVGINSSDGLDPNE